MVIVQTVFNKPVFCFTLSVSDVVQPENQLLLKTNPLKENQTNYSIDSTTSDLLD